MSVSFSISEQFPVAPEVIYSAWLDSEQHSQMTGGEATCSDQEGGTFSAWDGYISGTNLQLVPSQKIVQAWRTTEFQASDADSEIAVELVAAGEGCELTLTHTNIPEGQSDYEKGWVDHYFQPMKAYFGH